MDAGQRDRLPVDRPARPTKRRRSKGGAARQPLRSLRWLRQLTPIDRSIRPAGLPSMRRCASKRRESAFINKRGSGARLAEYAAGLAEQPLASRTRRRICGRGRVRRVARAARNGAGRRAGRTRARDLAARDYKRYMKVDRGLSPASPNQALPGWFTCLASSASARRSCVARSRRAARLVRRTTSSAGCCCRPPRSPPARPRDRRAAAGHRSAAVGGRGAADRRRVDERKRSSGRARELLRVADRKRAVVRSIDLPVRRVAERARLELSAFQWPEVGRLMRQNVA
jgi:hypothetical protein